MTSNVPVEPPTVVVRLICLVCAYDTRSMRESSSCRRPFVLVHACISDRTVLTRNVWCLYVYLSAVPGGTQSRRGSQFVLLGHFFIRKPRGNAKYHDPGTFVWSGFAPIDLLVWGGGLCLFLWRYHSRRCAMLAATLVRGCKALRRVRLGVRVHVF